MNQWALIIATTVLAAQQAAAEETGRTIMVRKADAGRLIPVKLGDDVVIQLNTVAGSAIIWQVRSVAGLRETAAVETIADPLRSPGAAGDPRVAAIRLRATATGDANAVIEEAPIGGGYGSNYLRFRFRVRQ